MCKLNRTNDYFYTFKPLHLCTFIPLAMGKTLCKSAKEVKLKPEEVRYVCKKCDRKAKKEKDLCKPHKA